MTTCFPFVKYLYFFISFVLSFVLASNANKMEVFGVGLMFAINYLYSLFIGNDVLGYIQKNRAAWSGWTGVSVFSLISGLMFNFVSSILILIAFVKMNMDNNEKMKLGEFGRDNFNVFKRMFMATVVLIGVVASNLYFSPDTIATRVTSLLNVLVEPTYQVHIFQILSTLVAIGLFFSVIDIIDFKLKDDNRLDKFRHNFKLMYSMLIGLIGLFLLRVVLAYGLRGVITTMFQSIGFDMFFDFFKWSLTIIAIVFWGFAISDFDNLGKPYFNKAHKSEATDTAEEKSYFHKYHKYKLRPKFIFFMLFTIFLLLSNLANSTYFLELILLVVKIFAPLAVMGCTAYNVYLANRLSKKSAKQLLVKKETST